MRKLVIYHGSRDIVERPYYHGGKAENDYGYGFYCTESLEMAKEWSCGNGERNGFANKYTVDLTGLRILNLTDKRYSILNWIAILLKFRTFDLINGIAVRARECLLKNFYIDVTDYDIVVGYRADDSYFSFARDFVNNTVPVRKLRQAMELGRLGEQVVIIGEPAFERLRFEGFETADGLVYRARRRARDEKAREDYLRETGESAALADDIFVLDIIRRGLKDGDPLI